MLDYDDEAATYDETRGGVPRASAAAEAVLSLLPQSARTLVDVGCGTGIVTARVTRPGLRAFGADPSFGMASTASNRLPPGRVVLADGRTLPFATASLDALSAIWLLHLIPDVADTIAEMARVLRPGGTLITTVDKDAAHDVGSDIDELLRPYRVASPSDAYPDICEYARASGLSPAAETRFPGHGQGQSPQRAAQAVRRGYFSSAVTFTPPQGDALADALDALPEPTVRRQDPSYRLIALHKTP